VFGDIESKPAIDSTCKEDEDEKFVKECCDGFILAPLVIFWHSSRPVEYKVGAIFSVTGPASFLGDPEKKTAEMIVDAGQRRPVASTANRSN
jgi:hypothetical protein